MLRRLQITSIFLFLLTATGGGLFLYHQHSGPEAMLRRDLEAEKEHNAELQKHNDALKKVVSRLEFEKRVAQIIVTRQVGSASGSIFTTLRFIEYSRDGETALEPAKEFTIEGKRVHIDAMVIKFEKKAVEDGDPLRGHSIGLFTKLYGEKQAPEQGFPIDDPRQEPAFYRGADPRIPQFEKDLWNDFWNLAADPAYARSKGVLVAQGQGVWGDFEKGQLYTLTLQSDGNPNLTHEKAPPIYQDAFEGSTTQPEK